MTPLRKRQFTLLAVVAVLAAAIATSVGPASAGTAATERVVVGYSGVPPLGLIGAAGGKVLRVDEATQFVVVEGVQSSTLARALAFASNVRYVERDARVAGTGASWNGGSWNGASWDGASWNGASWDGASWNGASWNGASWNGASWDGASWNGASWNGASWNGASWNGASWDGASWNGASWNGGSWNGASWDGMTSDSSLSGRGTMDPGYPHQWGIGATELPEAFATTIGLPNRILCVLDSGVDYTHPDLAPNMWQAADGTHGRNVIAGTNDPMDDAGHGTHVAGIAAAVTGNGIGIAGASQARIMAVKVLDATGFGYESDVATGLTWCRTNGAHVAVMSLGTTEKVKALQDAVSAADSAGMVLVASAGNDGCACTQYPAAYSGVLGVGAVDARLMPLDFSNRGSHVALAAPGYHILSTFPGESYAVGSGTSQAAPFVAGIAALAWSKNPTAHASTIENALLKTARDVHEPSVDSATGRGVVDAAATLREVMAS